MSNLPAPPFKSFMELRLHTEKDNEFRHWVTSRLLEMKVYPLNYVRYAYVMDDRIYVEYDDGTDYDSHQELDFTWDELMDTSNNTYRRAQEEKAAAEARRRAVEDLAARKATVKNLEQALEEARRKLEETE